MFICDCGSMVEVRYLVDDVICESCKTKYALEWGCNLPPKRNPIYFFRLVGKETNDLLEAASAA